MSGHMGVDRVTTENLRIVEIDVARNLLLIRGAVPGSEGGQVVVRPGLKGRPSCEAQGCGADQGWQWAVQGPRQAR